MHVGDGFHFAGATLQDDFAEIYGAASGGDGPENVSEILEAEFCGFIEAEKFCVDLGAAALVLHFGFAAGLLHQFGALKIDLGGTPGASVIDGFGGTGDALGGRGGRRRLTERGRSQNPHKSQGHKICRCCFHVRLPIAM